MKSLMIILLLLLCLVVILSLVAQTSDKGMRIKEMQTEQRVALVIGNSAYESRPLRNPVNDAKAMAVALRQCKFEVIEKTDCNRSEIREAVREFGDKIKRGGVGLFYYSGHGLQVKGENYLVPVGADVRAEDEVEDECVKTSAVLRKMETAGNRVNIVILDACRDNPFARSFGASTRGLARMDAPKGTFIAYATGPGSVAADGKGKNGVYTSALLKHIGESGLTIENVFKSVRVDVIKNTSDSQVPWESSSMTGDFYFILPDEDDLSDTSKVRPPRMPGTKIDKYGAEMVLVPAGEFQMGSNDGKDGEKPVHIVYLDDFYIDKYEVTNAQYRKFVKATRHREPEGSGYVNGKWQSGFKPWSDRDFNGDDQPVVCVSWEDAAAYCRWALKRLPTEAEWEKAARGGLVGKKYPWGDEITHDDANYGGTGGKDRWNFTSPVGSFPPNGYGLCDMAGNAWEWCADWYDYKYYANSPRSNPTGPGSGTVRAYRGGSWYVNTGFLRVGNRDLGGPVKLNNYIGFRCVSQD